MVRGSRAGVGSSKRITERGGEGLMGFEVAVMTGEEREVTNFRHTGPAHLGAAPVAGVDAIASVSMVEDREAGVKDVEDPWARALRGKILESTERGVRGEEV